MKQEFVQSIKDLVNDAVNGVHTSIPGTVESYDPATNTAVVKPSMQYKKPDGSALDYPSISGVPVVFPQGAGQMAAIAYPVKEGDGCLVIVSEQSLDYWMYGHETDTDLHFDLTNSIAIVGLFAAANPAAQRACDEDAIVIKAGDAVEAAVSAEQIDLKVGEIQFIMTAEGIEIFGNVKIHGTLAGMDDSTITGNVTIDGNFTTRNGIVRLNCEEG